MKPRFFEHFLHPICLVGIVIFLVGFGASTFALVGELGGHKEHAYQGLLTFVLYPSVIFLGFAVIAVGWIFESRRAKRLEQDRLEWSPALSWKNMKHRRVMIGISTFAFVFVFLSVFGAYHAYEFTESKSFCGELCHTPMEPQYVAHQDSPHASVACAKCHVGPGVRGYMDAKISGLRQLYEMIGSRYPRPIRAPYDKLPGTSDTCDGCHWSQQYWGMKIDSRTRYGYDLQNSKRSLQILFNLGGGDTAERVGEGIHWHMNMGTKVTFRATDDRKQDIAWVEIERADGSKTSWKHRDSKLESSEIEKLPTHLMECLDCHNRPAHRFLIPDHAIDQALDSGKIDSTLPGIKKLGVASLRRPEESKEEGKAAIRKNIEDFYRENFGGEVLKRKETVEAAIGVIQDIYHRHQFPGMKIDGYTHPNNIGHRSFPGCFRCHGGNHFDDNGIVLPSDCGLCHQFMERDRSNGALVPVPANGSSFHPFEHEDHMKETCWSCHDGSGSPYSNCASCHKDHSGGHAMRFECSICHKPGNIKMGSSSCAPCHPLGESELHAHVDHRDCVGCHKPHDWKVSPESESCAPCHESLGPEKTPLTEHYPGEACAKCHSFGGVQATMMGLPSK